MGLDQGDSVRVGHLKYTFPDEGRSGGGTATAVRGLAAALEAEGHHQVIYRHSREPDYVTAEGIDVVTTGDSALSFGLGRLTARIKRNQDQLDLLVLHGMFNPHVARMFFAARRSDVTTVASPHDPYAAEVFETNKAIKAVYWRALERRLLQGVDAIHVLAPSHAELLRARDIGTETFAIPTGISAASLSAGAVYRTDPARNRRPVAPPTVVYLGRLDPYNKGLDLLLHAWRAASMQPGTRLIIAGRGTPKAESALAAAIDGLGPDRSVERVGYVDDALRTLADADLVVVPSRFDGFVQVVLESLSVGTPVLVTNKVGASEYLDERHGVIAVEPTGQQIAAGLETALSNLDRLRAAAAEATRHLAAGFEWSVIARRWLDRLAGT